MNGYGVICRVATAVALQVDMPLAGVSEVVSAWRAKVVTRNGVRLFATTGDAAGGMRGAELEIAGLLDDLLAQADVVVNTPCR